MTRNQEIKEQCPEFPYFGAHYPDACCIDGFLWDLDSHDSEDGLLHFGGDVPCPFCNTEKFIEDHLGEDIEGEWHGKTREQIMAQIEHWKERYGNKIQQ